MDGEAVRLQVGEVVWHAAPTHPGGAVTVTVADPCALPFEPVAEAW